MAKYCQRIYPLVKRWYSDQSQSWNAMCKIKKIIDKQILWKIGRGDVSFWFDNWSELGSLYKFLPLNHKPKNVKLSYMFLNNHINWEGLDLLLPPHVVDKINNLQIRLNPATPDDPKWIADNNGTFFVASAWQLFRKN